MFSRYHYLSHSHNNSARVFIATINDEVCGYYSVLHLPHPKVKNVKRGHRLVILPDYQGISIGLHLSNVVARSIVEQGYRFVATTSSPGLIFARKRDPNWRCTSHGRKGRHGSFGDLKTSGSSNRLTTSWEFVLKDESI